MADPFVAEIRIFPFNFAPRGWAFCDGQLLPLSQNTALFSLLGTTYGGNGQSNFALPNLQDRAPRGMGQGPGLADVSLGEAGGTSTVALVQTELPAHGHAVSRSTGEATEHDPSGNTFAVPTTPGLGAFTPASGGGTMGTPTSVQGSSQPHNNLQPFLVLSFCIAMQGVFPPRS